MQPGDNAVLMRLEGALQSWGVTSRRTTTRDTAPHPSKSGVLGLICCAMGLARGGAGGTLERLAKLMMGIRVDRPGTLCADYHTVGAGRGVMAAGGKIKQTATTHELEAVVSQRLYLSDASFLVALLGNTRTVGDVAGALRDPRWPPYLGRKACVPSSPIFIRTGSYSSLEEALESEPWRARLAEVDGAPCELRAVLEARLASGSPVPADAVAVADVPVSFAPPVPLHEARYVVERTVRCRVEGPTQTPCPCPGRPWVDYRSPQWKQARAARAKVDLGLCVFCKQPMVDVHHVDYSHAGAEPPEDLRSLCRLCHDAISMIEYGGEAGTRRVDPCDHRVRALVLQKRGEILAARRVRGGPRRRR